MANQVFGPIARKLGTSAEVLGTNTRVDPVWLTSDERASGHMAVRSEEGRLLRISLERGTDNELYDGDVLAYDGEVALVVRATPADLLIVTPRTPLQWGVAGYQLGNLHRALRFGESAIMTPYDPMVIDLLDRLGVPHERCETPFVGQRLGAYSGHSH